MVFSLRVRGTRIADIASDTPRSGARHGAMTIETARRASLEFVCILGHAGSPATALPLQDTRLGGKPAVATDVDAPLSTVLTLWLGACLILDGFHHSSVAALKNRLLYS